MLGATVAISRGFPRSNEATAGVALDEPDSDHVVFLHGLSWGDYKSLLRMPGDHSAPRINYLEGVVEHRLQAIRLTSPPCQPC